MSKGAYIGLCVALFAVVYALCVWVVRPRMERDLVRRTKTALEKRSFKVKAAQFSGRDGQVEIVRTGPGQIAHAADVADQVFGVRVARITATDAPAPGFKIERVGENIFLTGVLPNEQTKALFMQLAEKAFAGMQMKDDLKISDSVSSPEYLAEVRPMISLLIAIAPEGFLELSGTDLTLAGETPDEESRARIEKKARELTPSELRLHIRLTMPERVQVAERVAQAVTTQESQAPDFRREVESTRLHFEFDSTAMTPDTVYFIEPLVELVKDHGGNRLKIIGHADATGTDVYNEKLSLRRSVAIAQMLKAHGIQERLLETEGRGETQPISDNTTEVGRAKNRRVEFEVVEGG